MKAYRITNTEGRGGREWRDMYETREAAAQGIATQMGWEEVVLSGVFNAVDGDGNSRNEWCAYCSREECDADNDGAYAPRIVEVNA